MGPSGAGKSAFLDYLHAKDKNNNGTIVGHGPDSETSDVLLYTATLMCG
jgi:ABC-type lipoprotein export system ATPase subunit